MKCDTALFYDIENIGCAHLKEIISALQRTGKIGRVAIQRAYAHWKHQSDKTVQAILALGIDLIEVGSYQKNAADIRLAADAMELLNYLPSIQIFVIVSGDGGFVQLAKKLHEYGKIVVGCGRHECTGTTLKEVCDFFLPIPDPRESDATEPLLTAPPAVGHLAGHSQGQIGHCESDQGECGRRYPGFLEDSPGLVNKMNQGGLPIGIVADLLRKIKDSNAGKHRWLIKLLLSICKGTGVCVAKSRRNGEWKIFARGNVPPEYKVALGT